jgi:hypothetical protein
VLMSTSQDNTGSEENGLSCMEMSDPCTQRHEVSFRSSNQMKQNKAGQLRFNWVREIRLASCGDK